jgi:FHS family L-fucose permease-like MFS transporter
VGFLVLLGILLLLKYRRVNSQGLIEEKQYPQVVWGMLAIFIYVGVEVSIQSNLGALLKLPEYGGLDSSQIAPYISLYWGSLMIGRWTGSLGAFKMGSGLKNVLTVIIPFLALYVVLLMNHFNGTVVSPFFDYSFCVCFLIAAFFLGRQKPAATLLIFGVLGMAAMLVAMLTTGKTSAYAFLSGGLFCSIMWPCIFSLATAGLGSYTSQASSFLIMMILGGAFIPPMQGLLADHSNIHFSYIITIFCFAFLSLYAVKVKQILSKAGIDYDSGLEGGH